MLTAVLLVPGRGGLDAAGDPSAAPATHPIALVSQQAPAANEVADLMALKLQRAESVLEGLALADFDLLVKESQALSLLSQEGAFRVLVTPEYAQHSMEFRRSADAVTKAARAKNVDAAALAYVDMTMRCVNCHKYVRDVRMASFELPNDEL